MTNLALYGFQLYGYKSIGWEIVGLFGVLFLCGGFWTVLIAFLEYLAFLLDKLFKKKSTP